MYAALHIHLAIPAHYVVRRSFPLDAKHCAHRSCGPLAKRLSLHYAAGKERADPSQFPGIQFGSWDRDYPASRQVEELSRGCFMMAKASSIR